MTRKIQELTLDKIAFFTNITHEFRTPITLIMGPIERALKLSYNPQVIEQLHFVERNSKYLLSLVNQLMDFRKAGDSENEKQFSKIRQRADSSFRGLCQRKEYHTETLLPDVFTGNIL